MSEDAISRMDHEALMKKQREHHRLRMRQEVDHLANDLAGDWKMQADRYRAALERIAAGAPTKTPAGQEHHLAIPYEAETLQAIAAAALGEREPHGQDADA